MAVFATFAEARESLSKNKWAYTEWDKQKKQAVTAKMTDLDEYLDDYAKIAAFLCNTGDFEQALANVSACMWVAYTGLDPLLRNRFTRAMGQVAVQSGFTFQNRMMLDTAGDAQSGSSDSAPIGVLLIGGDPQLGYMLRNKLFWKDGMDSRHGEHTHSLQWLAISLGASTTRRAADLYAKTADIRAPSQDDSKGVRSLTMWQWLCDCFPTDMKKFASQKFLNDETLESQSARSPQVIMDSLLKGKPQNHRAQFLAAYLFGRYRNRGWLTYDTGTKSVTNIQTKDIKAHRMEERTDHAWAKSPNSPARLIRDKDEYAKVEKHSPTDKKKEFEVTFHDLKGTLSYHYFE